MPAVGLDLLYYGKNSGGHNVHRPARTLKNPTVGEGLDEEECSQAGAEVAFQWPLGND